MSAAACYEYDSLDRLIRSWEEVQKSGALRREVLTEHTYDTWGNILKVTATAEIGNVNPLRYRGYVYDSETGFYYVGSRYYDAGNCRFISPDSILGQIGNIKSLNMFAYAFNNPVMYSDSTGTWPKLSTICAAVAIVAIAVVVGCVAVAGATMVSAAAEKQKAKSHTVYRLVDPNDSYKTKYVGRTVCESARKNAHHNDPRKAGLEFQRIATGLTYEQARGLEQIAMLTYNTRNALNRINGISPKNKKMSIYMSAGRDVAHYIENQVSNEILYWTGN